MRINQYLAFATGISRREADKAISGGKVKINSKLARLGQEVEINDKILLNNIRVTPNQKKLTLFLNKPAGYVCSRNGQGSKTIYDLVPKEFYFLKPVGRLDKDSSGLLIMTNDGKLAHQLSHPKFTKEKIYEVSLNRELTDTDKQIIEKGVELEDGISKLKLSGKARNWTITMHEGRNRQIRRTFAAKNYNIIDLHRTMFGPHRLDNLKSGEYKLFNNSTGSQ